MSKNIIFSAVIFVVIGIIVGLNLQQSQSTLLLPAMENQSGSQIEELRRTNQTLQTRLDNLETQFSSEQALRVSLSETLEDLKKILENKTPSLNLSSNMPESIDQIASNTTSLDAMPDTVTEANKAISHTLVAMGIDEIIGERIQEREEKMEMERLYLRNSAIREGWFGTEKYFEKSRQLNSETNIYREELGDENYDRYLFNTDQTNRISVLSVISNSPAAEAGLSKGDIILSYNDENIYSWTDLTTATTSGDMGQTVSVAVKRNDQEFEIFVPRGPLGIRLENIKVNPNI